MLSLTARGLTIGEIAAHFQEVYGAKISKDVYPVIFVDAMTAKR